MGELPDNCPFCGGAAELLERVPPGHYSCIGGAPWARCQQRVLPACPGSIGLINVAAWNRRAPQEDRASEVEAALREKVIEECAQVADSFAEASRKAQNWRGRDKAVRIAARIRALSPSSALGSEEGKG